MALATEKFVSADNYATYEQRTSNTRLFPDLRCRCMILRPYAGHDAGIWSRMHMIACTRFDLFPPRQSTAVIYFIFFCGVPYHAVPSSEQF